MISHDEQSYARIQTISLLVLAVAAATYSIYWLRPVLLPLVVALFVVSGVSPILKTLEKRLGVNRIVAACLTFLAGVIVLLVFGISIWVSMIDLKNNSSDYRGRIQEIVDRMETNFEDFANQIKDQVESILPSKGKQEESSEVSAMPSPPITETDDASEFVDTLIRNGISHLSQALVHLVSTSVVVLIYVFFLLMGTPAVSNAAPTVREIDHQVRSYLTLKTVVSIFTGLAFGVALRLFGVPMAFTFGVLAFLLNFVPNVGPLVASLLPIPLIVLAPDASVAWMASAILVTCSIQAISGNFIEPKIMGDSSDLHPVTILVALMFWGMMWGVIGMFLATPITAAVKIMLERIDSTKPIANLMAGRWTEDDTTGHHAEAVA